MLDFTCYETHHRIPLVPRVQFSHSNAVPSDHNAPRDMYFAEKYILDMHVSVSFYANNANFRQAEEDAKKRAVEFLFKDVSQKLMVIKAHAFKHNDSDLLHAIDEALSTCRSNTL